MVTSPIGMKMHCEKSVAILGGGNAMVLNAVSTESASRPLLPKEKVLGLLQVLYFQTLSNISDMS